MIEPGAHFECSRLRAKLSYQACVQQQVLGVRWSPCQDCALGREHRRALLGPEEERPIILPTHPSGRCLVCGGFKYKKKLCKSHYRQLRRHGRVILPGTICEACGQREARGTGLCLSCSRRRLGATVRGRRVELAGDCFSMDGHTYRIKEVRLWDHAQVLRASAAGIIAQCPSGLVLATEEP